MGSSEVLVCATAFLLILLSSAVEDENLEQREVTFDLQKIMQDMQQPDSFMLQEAFDLAEIFNEKDFTGEQVEVSPPELSERPGVLTPRGRRPSYLPHLLDYHVQFPPGQPTPTNLQAICDHGDHRPRYPNSYFPASGFGQQRRRASAVNNAESWFSTCCTGNQTWGSGATLCCATQAWELSVESFCREDSSVKDRLYDCCRLSGRERLGCFSNDAPNPNYEPTEELPVSPLPSTVVFNFDPNTCQRTPVTQYSARKQAGKKGKKPVTSQKIDINFPLGQPTEASIESLCRHQKLRPLYSVKCLPNVGYELLALQAKTINRIEKGFKHCCKKKQDVLMCADQKWRDELNRFCSSKKVEKVGFQCCSGSGTSDRHDCFHKLSPDPHYNMTSATEELSLVDICGTHKIIKKMHPLGFPLKNFVNKCCPLSTHDQTSCFAQEVVETSGTLCSSKKTTPPAVRRCCRTAPEESPQCITKILMDAITKATKVLRQKKKKRCPIS